MGGDGPIYDPIDAGTKKAGEELFCLDSAVDRSARRPLEALVVGLAVLGNDPAKFINGVLLLDVHQSDENAWNFFGLCEGEGKTVAKVDILRNELQ